MNSGSSSKRLPNELKSLQKTPAFNSTVLLENENQLNKWLILMQGPADTPYEAGVFKLDFKFPDNYPFKPPEVKFITTVYHPNIKMDTGDICQDIFASGWSPTMKVVNILEKLISMLKDPVTSNPFENEICNEFMNNRNLFEQKAREFTAKYATGV